MIFPGLVILTAGAALAAGQSVSPIGLWVFVLVLGGWVISLCLHEFGHAFLAHSGGDTSVRARGYLTLNPLKYTNTAMTFVIPVVILAIGGIPLPGGAVLIESHRLRSKAWQSTVSLVGPCVNLILGVLLTIAAHGVNNPLGYGLSFLALLQFVTAILNLLPVPGLDGFGVISPYLSEKTRAALRPITPWAPLLLIVILFSVPQAASVLFDAAGWLYHLCGGEQWAAAYGQNLFRFWR
ncbi:site-2 protease family protein [Nakamurella antarctica]|uniref:Site-2 protease family protein n=1 Tax=Nakamurella antarctica TaxID=1902245 RepID=A0A3G9A1A5_9ACTN|nr:site-2 protease family protein [Nakamurella antarctica]